MNSVVVVRDCVIFVTVVCLVCVFFFRCDDFVVGRRDE